MKKYFRFLGLVFIISLSIIACKKEASDSCDGVVCQISEICESGNCVVNSNFDPCDTVTCASDEFCQNGNCIDNSFNCTPCGKYSGTFSSDGDSVIFLPVAGQGLNNEPVPPSPFTAEVTKNANSSDSLDVVITLDLTVSGSTAKLPIESTVSYDAATNTFIAAPNQDISIIVIIPVGFSRPLLNVKLVQLSGTVDGTDIDGTIVIDDQDPQADNDYDATLTFEGTLD